MSRSRSFLSPWVVIASFFVAMSLPAQTLSPWSHVENLGPVVNSTASDSCLFVTGSGLSLYFGSSRAGGLGFLDLYVTQRASKNDPWGEPKSLGPSINTAGYDHLPYLTPDGHTMIFTSDRAGGPGFNDLYMSVRKNAADDFGWEVPVLIAELSTPHDEYGPWGFVDPATGRLNLYFGSDRPGGPGSYDIYESTLQANGQFSSPTVVQELSTSNGDVMPTFRQDGLELYLTSNRAGGLGSVDIWSSTRATTSEPWSTPLNVTALNTTAGEQRAGMTGDGREIFFFSGRPGGLGGTDLYRATRSRTTLIPIAGSTKGAHGSAFRTSAQLSNPGDAEISGHILFHPAGISAGENDPSYAYRLAPYESQTLPDVLASIGVSGVGSLEIVPDEGPAPASAFRIENGGSSVVVPPVEPASVMETGELSAVKMPSDMNRFRVNVGIRTLDTGATIWICIHEPDGTYLRGATHLFPPNTLSQVPVSELLGGEVQPDQMIMFTINGGSAVVYTSTLENNGSGSTLQIVHPFAE
ncbi:MAG: hypothetical protein ABR517_03985 [Thermoanaerobaculia bacterium]